MPGSDEIAEVGEPDSEQSLFAGKVPIKIALEQLRLRLLDLTGRNRQINFKHTAGKSLQFVHTSIDATFRRLTADTANTVTIAALPEPDRGDWVMRNGRLSRPEPKDHATRVGIDPSYELMRLGGRAIAAAASGSQARTLFYAEDLGKHCRKLEREAKLAIEETGANMLYLVMGFLEFPEAPDSDKLYRAPLLCVPVTMSKTEEAHYTAFHLSYSGEELADNLSLREKVKRDFELNLPEYDLEEEPSVEAYFDEVTEAVAAMPNWRVRRMMTLTLLSFSNMLLVRDLDPEKWPSAGSDSALLAHPLVKQVFEGRPSTGDAQYANEYAIDDHPKGDLPLIYDADSSQHSALIDVLDGNNRVIEGPPGTGKSQTITNLIAAALQAGKKVLFVAEKLAALEVVKSRLTLAGLDPFVLELHSNKTNKKRVLEDLAKRINMRAPDRGDLPELLERQEQKRKELKAYADLMNTKVGNNLELTLHQVMWRAERHRMRCDDCAAKVQHLDFTAAPRTTSGQFAVIRDRLRYLAGQLEPIGSYSSAHPLWGFFPTEFKPEDDLPVQKTLQEFAARFEAFAAASSDAAALLGGANVNMSFKSAEQLLSVLANLAPANVNEVDFAMLPFLFTDQDPGGKQSRAILLDIQVRQEKLAQTELELQKALVKSEPATPEVASAAKESLLELKVLGLASLDQGRLATTRDALQLAADTAKNAVGRLHGVATATGLTFSGTSSDLLRLQALATCLAKAPMNVAHLRHEGLRSPSAAAVLRDGQSRLRKIQEQQAEFDEILYTDLLPAEEDLKQAILTLREGDTWYRFLQGAWRKAIKLHRGLERNKSKRSGSERLKDLEAILKHQDKKRSWHANADLRSAAGPHFKGEETPLADLAVCADWISQSTSALEAVELPAGTFDPIDVERATLNRLVAQVLVFETALAELGQFDATSHLLLQGALPRVLKDLDSGELTVRVRAAERATHHLQAALNLMKGRLRPETAAETGLRAVMASLEVPVQIANLAAHEAGRALLGSKFKGRDTDLAPIFAAHTYGSLVKQAALPAAIERVLLSDQCVDNHSRLVSCVHAINLGWQVTLDFSEAMRPYGRFEPALWLDPAGKTTSEYANALALRTRHAAEHVGGLLPWAQYVGARQDVVQLGLEAFVKRLESGEIPADKLEHAFIYRFYASVAQSAFEKSALLRQFSGLRHSSIRSDYAAIDREVIQLRGRQVGHDCRRQSNPPAGNHSVRVDEKTEMKLLEHLIPQQRPRVPVRQMLRRAGRAIQELKPCFMMGPQAVAQFLEPGRLQFDIVVMDEASQLRPEEAIGAIARGKQLVVVGDPKQLPPTSFFARMIAPDSDDEGLGQMATSEAESILDVCISHFQPVRTLRWHYRSRHESLIAFSNHHFYRGNLVVFPSPYPKSKALGLRYQYVSDGVYESQMNQIEARRVVDAAVEHILHRPDDSLGLVTLNIKQRDLVSELLEERLRVLPEAVAFRERWEAEGMGLFIKNLENVQGDERDCIVISTTFGRPKGTDVVRQNFGPISREGGWRRLNVLFTRARKSVAVFSSMRPEDIVVDARTPEGTRALRNYLEFARTGVLPIERETGLPPDSDFEIAVMDVLRGRGFEVTPQLGVAGFRIDIGVKHPTHRSGYLAAIECDGASYHSGVSVRDRDRIRQEILESLGWKGRIWRIWSTDWFRNPLAETERLLQFLHTLRDQPVPDEYLFAEHQEVEPQVVSPLADETMANAAESLVFDDEDDDLEVEIGDLVTYAPAESPTQVIHVRITPRQTDLAQGLVAENTPLGTVLLGATVGETVVLRVPGKAAQGFVIQGIKRAAQEATQ